MKNSNCAFSSYVDFVHYMSRIPKKKTEYEKNSFYVKLVHKVFLDHVIWLRKYCEIYKKFCDAEVKMLCCKGLIKP